MEGWERKSDPGAMFEEVEEGRQRSRAQQREEEEKRSMVWIRSSACAAASFYEIESKVGREEGGDWGFEWLGDG